MQDVRGLCQWHSGKESACNAGDAGGAGLTPGSGRCPGGGNGSPLQYSCLENSMDRGAWRATDLGVTESQTGQSDLQETQKQLFKKLKYLLDYIQKKFFQMPILAKSLLLESSVQDLLSFWVIEEYIKSPSGDLGQTEAQ